MYLPRIMAERYGWAGFIVFAVPNVLGCAAFGYVVKDRVRSQAMVIRHGPAMAWFSAVTIAFHMFFIAWLVGDLIRAGRAPIPGFDWWMPVAAAAIVWALGLVLGFMPDRDWLWLSALTYGFSIATAFGIGLDGFQRIPAVDPSRLSGLWWMTPTICFGFLLCPYLDLTFHRALQNAPGRHAFAIFGAAFLLMILLTLLIWFAPGSVIAPLALAHLTAQTVFTVGAHLREIRLRRDVRSEPGRSDLGRGLMMTLPLLGAAALPLAQMAMGRPVSGEGVYLRFLAFYGLVFPTYALMFIWAWRSRRAIRSGTILIAALVLFSLPLYEAGFLHGREPLLLAPLAVLAFWVVLAPRAAR